MKPDTMRRIDFYVGVPLTFACSVLFSILRFFKPIRTVKPSKILFLELSEMGSTILADPAMRKAKNHFTAELYFVIFQRNRPSLKLLNTVSEKNIFTLRESNLVSLAFDVIKFIFWCRHNRIDTVIDLELFSRFSALLSLFSGASEKVGFFAYYSEGLYRGDFYNRKVSYNPYLHISKNFIALVNALISTKPERPYSKTSIADSEIKIPPFQCPEKDKLAMVQRIIERFPDFDPACHRLIIVNPNSSALLPQRRWMPENFVELTRKILDADPRSIIVLTGAPGEEPGSDWIMNRINNKRCLNLTGQFQLEDLPVLYSIATLMISNDSGPVHFASITTMTAIVIYGPETPALYGSLGKIIPIYAGLACSPCVSALNHRKTSCSDNVCLQVISPDMVFDKVKPFLNN
ncbi:MAG: glycosyltransferase family 9 protein [Proteobacteria bacterium]|nr:glycosyltransferase family 9 protein [Pseudomonadota bacterium]MBU1738353.1 glycosyltransferase family 9 protein [Pseudomonadota bacterium]